MRQLTETKRRHRLFLQAQLVGFLHYLFGFLSCAQQWQSQEEYTLSSAFFLSLENSCTVRYAVTPTHFFLVVLRMVAVLLAVSLSSSEPSLIEILG